MNSQEFALRTYFFVLATVVSVAAGLRLQSDFFSRPLFGWIEPVSGEPYFLDGRLCRVTGCDDSGVYLKIGDGDAKVSHRYWKRRARPAASEPHKVLAMQAAFPAHRNPEEARQAAEDRLYEAVHMRPPPQRQEVS